MTVGALVVDPIVITGPPPDTFDACASTPTSVTSRVIVTPPAKVPGPILIVAPDGGIVQRSLHARVAVRPPDAEIAFRRCPADAGDDQSGACDERCDDDSFHVPSPFSQATRAQLPAQMKCWRLWRSPQWSGPTSVTVNVSPETCQA